MFLTIQHRYLTMCNFCSCFLSFSCSNKKSFLFRLFCRKSCEMFYMFSNKLSAVFQGFLVSVCSDDTLYLWTLKQKVPEVVHSLTFKRERYSGQHRSNNSLTHLHFLLFHLLFGFVSLILQGALVSVCKDDHHDHLHLWTLRQKRPEIVHSLKFQRERQLNAHIKRHSFCSNNFFCQLTSLL